MDKGVYYIKPSYIFLAFQGIMMLPFFTSSVLGALILYLISKNLDFAQCVFLLLYGLFYPLILAMSFILYLKYKNNIENLFTLKTFIMIMLISIMPYLFFIKEAFGNSFIGIVPIIGLFSLFFLGYPFFILLVLLPYIIFIWQEKKQHSSPKKNVGKMPKILLFIALLVHIFSLLFVFM